MSANMPWLSAVSMALSQPCGRCHGRGSERHQVSRDLTDGYEDWPCPSCKGTGLLVTYGTPDDVAKLAIDAVLALPVEERMEAMGMRPWVRFPGEDDRPVWIEANDHA